MLSADFAFDFSASARPGEKRKSKPSQRHPQIAPHPPPPSPPIERVVEDREALAKD
jgi:hypothetical protein